MERSPLLKFCKHFCLEKQKNIEVFPDLSVLRRDRPSRIEAYIYEPVICLILQGSKMTAIGDQLVELQAGEAVLVSHDLPVVSRITKASVHEPYIALIFSLDLGLVRALHDQIADAQAPDLRARSLMSGPADPVWLRPLVKYLELTDSPLDAKVLGPSVRHEIHYRLLLSPIGGMLRNLLVADSRASRIAKAIEKVRADFRAQLSISVLAKSAGMSVSSFHEHFKIVTGTTPLQYLKDLRLIEARALLAERTHTVSEAAYAVGYESPTHFSRDYSRKFGLPPSKDTGDRDTHSAIPR